VTAPLTVVIAPDSFKGTLTAAEAARAIAEGWRSVRPADVLREIPQADGGEGTLDALAASTPGARFRSAGQVTGPDARPVEGVWLELPSGTGVVELAQASGLPLMQELDPLGATSRGLGEVIAHAAANGAPSLIVALGGSASTDGGTGALSALGARFLDEHGDDLPDGGGALRRLHSVDARALVALPPMVLLTDVRAPLLGPEGAAAVFGPQKGASPDDVQHLEEGLRTLAAALSAPADVPGMGAAGGTAYGLVSLLGASVRPGADVVAQSTGLYDAIAGADVVITGEGRFDSQSRTGKVTGAVLDAARRAGAAPGVIAGAVEDDPGTWSVSLAALAGSPAAALADAAHWARAAGAAAAAGLPLRYTCTTQNRLPSGSAMIT
jgi:glycerate kinase